MNSACTGGILDIQHCTPRVVSAQHYLLFTAPLTHQRTHHHHPTHTREPHAALPPTRHAHTLPAHLPSLPPLHHCHTAPATPHTRTRCHLDPLSLHATTRPLLHTTCTPWDCLQLSCHIYTRTRYGLATRVLDIYTHSPPYLPTYILGLVYRFLPTFPLPAYMVHALPPSLHPTLPHPPHHPPTNYTSSTVGTTCGHSRTPTFTTTTALLQPHHTSCPTHTPCLGLPHTHPTTPAGRYLPRHCRDLPIPHTRTTTGLTVVPC